MSAVRHALKAGAHRAHTHDLGTPALVQAALYANPECLRVLLDLGADVKHSRRRQLDASHGSHALRRPRVGYPRDGAYAVTRDPKVTPHPGDRFRCKNGTELEATGAVFSITKSGGQTPCLYVSRIVDGRVVSRGVSTIGVFKSGIRSAELVARGSDLDPWVNAERCRHSDF